MAEEAIGEVVIGVAEALGEFGSLGDSSSRRRRRGCGWFALIGLVVIVIAVGVALLNS